MLNSRFNMEFYILPQLIVIKNRRLRKGADNERNLILVSRFDHQLNSSRINQIVPINIHDIIAVAPLSTKVTSRRKTAVFLMQNLKSRV